MKFKALGIHESRENGGGARNVKSVLGVPYKIAVLVTLQ
jgi:hypothetical protein